MTEHSADHADARRIRSFVADQIETAGWGPGQAIAFAKDRDAVERLRACVMLVRLCGDPESRSAPEHALIHRSYGLTEHAGPELVKTVQRGLGFSDARAQHLIAQLDAETNVAEGIRSD